METTMKRFIIGQLYLPSDVQKNIMERLFLGPTVRENFFMNEQGRMIPELRDWLYEVIGEALKGTGVQFTDVMLVWSRKAGCGMCPCSPGFHVSIMVPHHYGLPASQPGTMIENAIANKKRDRLHFYVESDGSVDVRVPSYGGRWEKNVTQTSILTILPKGYQSRSKSAIRRALLLEKAKGTQLGLFEGIAA